MDFKKQRPTYRRASGEGRLTAPGNHSSRAGERPTAPRSEQRAKAPSGSKLFSQREKVAAPRHVAPKPSGRAAKPAVAKPATPKRARNAVKPHHMFGPAVSEFAQRMGVLEDVAQASATYTTAPGDVERVTASTSSAAAEHALEDSRRRRARVARMAIVVGTVAVLAAILVSVFALRRDAVTGIEGDAYAHIVGQRVDLTAPVKLERQNNAWVAVSENGSFTMDGRPLYAAGTNSAYFGDGAMVVLPARQGSIRQVPARARLTFENGLSSLISHEGKTEPIESGFIYDGSDTYTLLTEATLTTSAGDLTLSALSSIEAVPGGGVYVYDRGSEMMQVFDAGSARLSVDDGTMTYEVDLLADTLTVRDVEQLLLGSAASMPSIFE